MSTSYIDIQFSGKGFSPKKLRDLINLPVEVLIESGEISKVGRYKGTPSPYGIGLLKIELSKDSFYKYCRILYSYMPILKKSKVEEIVFDIETDTENFNAFPITPAISDMLSSLNARVEFNQELSNLLPKR